MTLFFLLIKKKTFEKIFNLQKGYKNCVLNSHITFT